MIRERRTVDRLLAGLLSLFVLWEVNYPTLTPQSRLAIFAMLGLVLLYRNRPVHPRLEGHPASRAADGLLALLSVACCAFIVTQTEPWFRGLWIHGQSLGNRAGQETTLDTLVGVLGLLLVLEATRRVIGWALPALALAFLLYALIGPHLPSWLFPHRGYGVERIVAQTFLHSQGVFGTALRVMFVYVFLFVLFGAVLQRTGATRFVIDFARGLLGATPGGPAKVAVLSSGMMGSLSGSAVANTATTGTFTIPMMRESGFTPETAAGVEAAASSGGALVPPVMGAGAYMMLEIIEPRVSYLQIIQAALIPAVLYYLSLFLIVHFHSRRIGAGNRRSPEADPAEPRRTLVRFEGLVFAAGIAGLIVMLLLGYTVFRAATISLLLVLLVSSLHRRTRLSPKGAVEATEQAARDAVPLICAAASVGIVIGVVTLTGVGTRLPATILELSQGSLFLALVLIMISSIVLGMGMPSAVCYLLMATLIGPVLGNLGVVPLAAHLFIFYFGMLSMVTPPVALAAYTAASIAGARIMRTSVTAFRFALVGFTLPYMFVYRPQLLMLDADGGPASAWATLGATTIAAAGILALAAGISGHLLAPLTRASRAAAFAAAALLLFPKNVMLAGFTLPLFVAGLALLAIVAVFNRRGTK